MQEYVYQSPAGAIILRDDKTAFLPDFDTLLLADIHFEKASFLQVRGGAPLPALDTFDGLARLSDILTQTRPKRVIALGDSFHDVAAGARMSEDQFDQINNLCQSVHEFIWVLGNHDPDIPAPLCGTREDHVQLGNFLLTHEPEPAEGGINICGHFHPKIRIKTRRGYVSAPCFAWDEGRVVLPSFGTFTGGLDVLDPAFDSVLPGQRQYCAVTRHGLYCFPNG